jgi:hypothetical protein
MKKMILTIALMLAAVPVLAGAPQVGVYLSTDLGGPMLVGRFSESWVDPGSQGQVGNTIDAQSYDTGSGLGSQWKLYCASIAFPPSLVSDTRDANGSGDVSYRTEYTGGLFWMSKNGPWGDGSVDYTGTIDRFIVNTTYMYVNNQVLGIRSNVTTIGTFDNYGECFEYTINNAAFYGDTDTVGPLPAGFPPFMDSSCQTGTRTRGGWGSVTEIALRIRGNCTVPTQESTWGSVKALYE